MNEEFIDLLLQRCDIETVVTKYMTLKRSGSSLVGLCPFHDEKTPSFHVTKEKGLFRMSRRRQRNNVCLKN